MSRERPWSYWLFIGLLVIAHFVLHVGLGIGPAAPDLLTIALLLAARELGILGAASLGFGLGLLQDALSLDAFGAGAVTLTVLGMLGARSRDWFVGESVLFSGLYLFVGSWLGDVLYYLLTTVVAGVPARAGATVRLLLDAPIAAAYAAAVGVLALVIYHAVTGER